MKAVKNAFYVILTIASYSFIPVKITDSKLTRIYKHLDAYSDGALKLKYIIIIDYNKSFLKRRLWVIEKATKEVVINCHVSHAKNSGGLWATEFSNMEGSEKSCAGVFKTLNSYKSSFGKGKYQIGMRIEGLDKQLNSNALKRNIVFHCGYTAWSRGCFVTTPKNNKKIIELTKEGNLVYVLT